jgi:hypothetical protein
MSPSKLREFERQRNPAQKRGLAEEMPKFALVKSNDRSGAFSSNPPEYAPHVEREHPAASHTFHLTRGREAVVRIHDRGEARELGHEVKTRRLRTGVRSPYRC